MIAYIICMHRDQSTINGGIGIAQNYLNFFEFKNDVRTNLERACVQGFRFHIK
jgi:hypothetical protein